MAHVSKKKQRAEARFPAHYDCPVSKVEKVKTKAGTYTVNVFNVGKDFRGKSEYEYEVIFPDEEQYGTRTKKYASTSEAVMDAVREIKLSLERAKKEKAGASKAKRGAKKKDVLEIAEERGWTFKWEPEEGTPWEDFVDPTVDDPNDIEEVDSVALLDENGNVLASLGGVVFMKGTSTHQNQEYGREIERELVEEALHHENETSKLMRT
jgi:hypothetical protein